MLINIIGDIAGRYDELMLLLQKMPKADLTIAVGDLIDRGPKSREVLEWFMNNQDKAIAIYGNHEDMMVQFVRNPDDWNNRSIWLYNGGKTTLESFRDQQGHIDIPLEIIEFIEKCPMWWKNNDLIISHAPINFNIDAYSLPDQYNKINSHFFFWNRMPPNKRVSEHLYHIYGHNGEHRSHSDHSGEYAFCIDNSHNSELTGMHWPSKEIFRQEFLS